MATLTSPPTAPNPNDPKTFEANADAHLSWLALNVSEMNAFQAALTAIAAGTAFAIPYTFSTTTTDSDPGPGFLQLDNATQNAATTIRADLLGSDGSTWTNVIDTFDDSTSTVKGQIMLVKLGDATKWLAFNVTALASPAGYKNIAVTNVASSSANPFIDADVIVLKFTRVGDKGDVGANGTNGTNGTNGLGVPAQVIVASTATTLTSTATLLQITPDSYGVAVTMPDATTCALGGPLHIVDNKSVYQVKVLNASGTLLGFIFAGVVSHISLIDKSTSAGVWSIDNIKPLGIVSARLSTPSQFNVIKCIALDADREFVIGYDSTSSYLSGFVYRSSTDSYSSLTLIRAVAVANRAYCVLQTSNQVLVVSCAPGSTAFEAVICSINSSTDAITPNTAATATLSANMGFFADGCGLIQVGTSFITSYAVATPEAQIREITVSGTTPTISAARGLDGTDGGLIVAGDATHVIAVSTATTHLYTRPYTIGGLSPGTGTDTTAGTMYLGKFFPLGDRWGIIYSNTTGPTTSGGVVSLSGTATTVSIVDLCSDYTLDAMVVETNKVLVITGGTSNNANILTDTAGTASAGTAIALSNQTARVCVYAQGTDVYVQDGSATFRVFKVDCSGSSPTAITIVNATTSNTEVGIFNSSNAMLIKGANGIYGSDYAATISGGSVPFSAEIKKGIFSQRHPFRLDFSLNSATRGKSDSERWMTGVNYIAKVGGIA